MNWKPIQHSEHYEVSNTGRVRNRNQKILSPYKSNKYRAIDLYKEGIIRKCLVHRLVSTAFVPNPHNYPEVNHLDGDPTNNNSANLTWSTHKQNINHAINELGSTMLTPKVKVRTIRDGIIMNFNSITEAGAFLNIRPRSISSVLSGDRKTAGGLEFQRVS